MGHDVFVSHSSKDKGCADAVVAQLERSGIRCWVAPRDIRPGANWAGSIVKAIADAKLMVLVFSGHADSSEHVRREVERAVFHGIPVVPLRIQDVLPSEALEYFLSSAHWLDAMTPPLERHLAILAEKIKSLLDLPADAPGVARPSAAMPAPSPRPRSRWPWLAVAVVIVAVVVFLWLGIAGGDLRRVLSGWTGLAPSVSSSPSSAPVASTALPTASVASAPPQFLPPTASRDQRLELLRQLYMNNQLTVDQVHLATGLLDTPFPALSAYDSARLTEINNVLEGRLPPDKLGHALDAIETPEQLQERLAREEDARAEAARQARINGFLATARANDNEDHDTVALAALDELLKFDPGNAMALQLRDKISQYAPMKKERLAREAAADRQAKVDPLLAVARANDDEDHDTTALAALTDALKIDPANAEALRLREKISQYAPMKTARLAREAAAKAAADRQAKIDSLLATAAADDNKEHGRDGLAALDELLTLDPQNAPALSLREKIKSGLKPSKIGDTLTNSLGMTLAYIPAGTFVMGSPADEAGRFDNETQHKVTLTRSFLMATTHVTKGQFVAFARDSGYQTDAEKEGWAFAFDGKGFSKVNGASWRNPGFDQGDDHPVVCVSWNDATAFCDWLSRKEGKHYRLPTEAQWEYSCRAGTQTAYPWGNNPDDGRGWANCADQTAKQKFPDWAVFNWDDGYVFTSPVGKFRPNAWGLYDMIGNAWEWCGDWYGNYPAGDATDPASPGADNATNVNIPLLNYNGPARVLRGGSWLINPLLCRCAYRNYYAPVIRNYDFGFRVVLDFE